MKQSRREFLKWVGLSTLGAVASACVGIPERELRVQSPATLPEDLVKGVDNWYATLCGQCSSGCGVVVRVMEGRAKKIEGNLDFPVNRGKHLARCEAGLQDLYHPDRLKSPLSRSGSRGSGEFSPTDWEAALDRVVSKLADLKASGNADTVAIVTPPYRGHLGLVVSRFAKAYGATYMPFEPTEELVLKEAIKRTFGQDVLPDFDIDHANYVLSFGADFLGTWLSPVRFGRGYGEFRQGTGRKRGTFVQIEPRMSHTAASADMWIPVKPGWEGAVALSIAYVLISERLADQDAARQLTGGPGVSALEEYAPEKVAEKAAIPRLRGKAPAQTIREIARQLAENKPALVIGGGCAGAQFNGLANLMAIYSLNYLLGSVREPGGVVFNPDSPLKDVPAYAKGTSFAEWETLVQRMRDGRPKPVNMVLVYGVDLVYGLPDVLDFTGALKNDTLVVNFSNFIDETARYADLVLPVRMYLEGWGDDIPAPGPGYQTVGFQQPVVNPLPTIDVKGSFGDLLLMFAEELGSDMVKALPWNTVESAVREGARELFQLKRGSVQANTFEEFWVGVLQRGGWWDVNTKATTQPPPPPRLPEIKPPAYSGPTDLDSFHLIPFKQIALGDGRHAHLPWLQALPDPITSVVWSTWVEINRERAKEMGLSLGDIVSVQVAGRGIEAAVYPHPAIPPDVVAVPLGQGHASYGRYATGRGDRVIRILAAVKEEQTGALAWAATRVRLIKTGKRIDLPKAEGNVPAFEIEPGRIIKVTPA